MYRALDRCDYQNVAWLLIEIHGRYAVEFARRRAVSGRFIGDAVETQDWLKVSKEAQLILRGLQQAGSGEPVLLEMNDSPGAANAALDL